MMIGAITANDNRVPRVPDKNPAKYAPVRKRRKAVNLSIFEEFFQSARQKIETPSIQKEKGIGFPENNLSLPVWKLWKLLVGSVDTKSSR